MTARFPLAVLLLGGLALAACDSGADGDSERVSGVWEGTVPFHVDTVLTEHNYRVVGDYTVDVRFDLVHDDGLSWGLISASFDGQLVAREAGARADTFRFNPDMPVVDAVFGTFVRPELELDVPWGPYSEDLWTFDKVGGRLDLKGQVKHLWRFIARNVAEPDTFTFELPMDARSIRFDRTSDSPSLPDSILTGLSGPPPARTSLLQIEGLRRRAVLGRMHPEIR